MMNRRHPPIKYCPLTLHCKVILEICKKLNLRSKNEVPARRRKENKLILCTERQMNICNEHEHLLITYHIQDLAMSAIYMKRWCHISLVLRAGKKQDWGYLALQMS